MSKKLIILIIILATIGVGIFFWMNREIKGSPDDYVINGDIIENKRAGLKVQAPKGWDIEKTELSDGSVVFDSPDIEGEWRNNMVYPPLTKGCGIEIGVLYEKMDLNKIRGEMENIHFRLGMISEEFEEIEINNKKALKKTFDTIIIGPGIFICYPVKSKVYSFAVYWSPDDKERCIKEFEEMLNRAEIKSIYATLMSR